MDAPRHGLDGVKQGMTAAVAGVGAGLASLVALPVQGARENGVRGAASGLAKGVGAAVVCTGVGAGVGLFQIGSIPAGVVWQSPYSARVQAEAFTTHRKPSTRRRPERSG